MQKSLKKMPVIFIYYKKRNLLSNLSSNEDSNEEADDSVKELAKCLANSGATLYIANYCDHCQEQKSIFGDAFKHLSTFDCAENKIQDCIDAGVKRVPTWKFSDGTILEGMQSLSDLAEASGCKYEEEG